MAQALYNGGGGSADDVWDDTELVQHFDKALEASRKSRSLTVLEADTPGPWLPLHEGERELDNLLNTEQPLVLNSENSNQSITFGDTPWKVGSSCRALYSEDNVEYEAKILEMLDTTSCIVRFVGYGNEEQMALSNLKPSKGKKVRDLQRIQALQLLAPEEQNMTNGHEVEVDLATAEKTTETTPIDTAAGTTPNDHIPPEYEELRERVRNIIFSTHNVFEDTEAPEESYESRFKQLQPTRRNKKKNVSRAHPSASTSGTNVTMNGFASTSAENVFVAPKPKITPQNNSFGQDSWKQAFPNLLMPPMPNSLADQDGKMSFGKGELPSLLMTWYMAGYHSGAFDAKQEMRKKIAVNKNRPT